MSTSTNPAVFETRFREDGSCDVRARVMAKDATGSSTKAGEGYALTQSDLSSIAMSVFDITDPSSPVAPSGVTNPATLTVSDVISDTLVTTSALWKSDSYGYNFAYIIPAANFPTGGKQYQVEFKFTTTGGTVGFLVLQGTADAVAGS